MGEASALGKRSIGTAPSGEEETMWFFPAPEPRWQQDETPTLWAGRRPSWSFPKWRCQSWCLGLEHPGLRIPTTLRERRGTVRECRSCPSPRSQAAAGPGCRQQSMLWHLGLQWNVFGLKGRTEHFFIWRHTFSLPRKCKALQQNEQRQGFWSPG